MQKYKLFGLAPPIWVAQYIYYIDIQRIIKCESKRCQSQEKVKLKGKYMQRFGRIMTETDGQKIIEVHICYDARISSKSWL